MVDVSMHCIMLGASVDSDETVLMCRLTRSLFYLERVNCQNTIITLDIWTDRPEESIDSD